MNKTTEDALQARNGGFIGFTPVDLLIGNLRPIELRTWPNLDAAPFGGNGQTFAIGMVTARSDSAHILREGSDSDEIRHGRCYLFLARKNGDDPHAVMKAVKHIVEEVTNNQVWLASATVHNTASKGRTRGIPLDIERPAAVDRCAMELHPARSTTLFLSLGYLEHMKVEFAVALDFLPQAWPGSTEHMNHSLHSANSFLIGCSLEPNAPHHPPAEPVRCMWLGYFLVQAHSLAHSHRFYPQRQRRWPGVDCFARPQLVSSTGVAI